jgi:hypothetical protein
MVKCYFIKVFENLFYFFWGHDFNGGLFHFVVAEGLIELLIFCVFAGADNLEIL